MLALLAERAAGAPFHELVAHGCSSPAGWRDTAYLRSDELPGDAAIGYLGRRRARTNVFHLPVRGSGDGGTSTTAADIAAFWTGAVRRRDRSARARRRDAAPRSETRRSGAVRARVLARRGGAAVLVGADAGVSFPRATTRRRVTGTVIANATAGAWAMADAVDDALAA